MAFLKTFKVFWIMMYVKIDMILEEKPIRQQTTCNPYSKGYKNLLLTLAMVKLNKKTTFSMNMQIYTICKCQALSIT